MVASTTRFNKCYLLHHLLGQGGMGAVYCATDRLTGDIIALKQVSTPPDFLSDTPSDSDSEIGLSNEFRTLALLRHPNIISVLDYGFEEKQPDFTMELLKSPRTILTAGKDTSWGHIHLVDGLVTDCHARHNGTVCAGNSLSQDHDSPHTTTSTGRSANRIRYRITGMESR